MCYTRLKEENRGKGMSLNSTGVERSRLPTANEHMTECTFSNELWFITCMAIV